MKKLGKAMGDMFAFYCETEELHNARSHKGTIECIVQQTMESALLIHKYAETLSFCTFIPIDRLKGSWLTTLTFRVTDCGVRCQQYQHKI